MIQVKKHQQSSCMIIISKTSVHLNVSSPVHKLVALFPVANRGRHCHTKLWPSSAGICWELNASTERLDGTQSAAAHTDKGEHKGRSSPFSQNTQQLVLTGWRGGPKGSRRDGWEESEDRERGGTANGGMGRGKEMLLGMSGMTRQNEAELNWIERAMQKEEEEIRHS